MIVLGISPPSLNLIFAIIGAVGALFGIINGFKGKYSRLIASCVTVALLVFFWLWLSVPGPDEKKIVLLLPAGSENEFVSEDAQYQFLGLFDFLQRENPDTTGVVIVPLRHCNQSSKAREMVIEEMKRGAIYFVATMSSINEPLAQNWKSLRQRYCKNGDGFLIATVASAPEIPDVDDHVFRFYIRSEEEVHLLSKLANEKWPGLKSAVTACVGDHYGKSAAKMFKELWEAAGNTVSETISLELDASADLRLSKLRNLKDKDPGERQIVFIANYGSGIAEIIQGLRTLTPRPRLLITSTFSIKGWREKTPSEELREFEWITVQPDYYRNEEDYQNVVRDFTYFTLLRVALAIKLKNERDYSFAEAWKHLGNTVPDNLRYELLNDQGDCRIPLREYEHPGS